MADWFLTSEAIVKKKYWESLLWPTEVQRKPLANCTRAWARSIRFFLCSKDQVSQHAPLSAAVTDSAGELARRAISACRLTSPGHRSIPPWRRQAHETPGALRRLAPVRHGRCVRQFRREARGATQFDCCLHRLFFPAALLSSISPPCLSYATHLLAGRMAGAGSGGGPPPPPPIPTPTHAPHRRTGAQPRAQGPLPRSPSLPSWASAMGVRASKRPDSTRHPKLP
jgi:hypothetical protein